jgi:hypothetical protein
MTPHKPFAVLLLLALPLGGEGIKFREVSRDWGIDFRHHFGGSGRRYMVETMVGGVVMFDFDGDGDEDLFFVDGGSLPGYTGEPARSRLFRNDGNGHFVDWTEKSGIKIQSYGVGGTTSTSPPSRVTTSFSATMATAPSPTSPPRPASARTSGALPRPSPMSTTTVPSTSSWSTTWTFR